MIMVDYITGDNHHFRLIFDSSAVAMILVDGEGIIRMVNRQTEKLFNYRSEQLLGNPIEVLVPQAYQAKHQIQRKHFYQQHQARPMGAGRYMQAVRQDGVEFPVEIGLTPVKLDDDLYVLSTIVDLTFQKQMEEKALELARELEEANKRLKQLASTDELTGLYNRRAFDVGLNGLIRLMNRMGSSLSLLLIDIDHFKQFNDELGHPAGDELLRILSNLLLNNSRGSDMVARYGGEEFAILMPATNAGDAVLAGEKIRRAIQDYDWHGRKPTISLGVSTVSFEIRRSGTLDYVGVQLILAADQALYYSKRGGRNKLTHIQDIENSD
jgi:diguanylate cyclase (GGDEF)-like protein/PAS domain S-box-containing protein